MKLTEAQIGILATIGAVMLAVVVFLFSANGWSAVFAGEKNVNTWGVYIEPWFLVVLLIAIPIAIVAVIVRRARSKRVG